MFVVGIISISLLFAIFIIWTGETFFYKSMFGETLKSTDPNFDVYDLAIDNSSFELLKCGMVHSCNEESAIRYIDKIDMSLLKSDFFHIHSKDLEDRRVVKGTELYQKISDIMERTKDNNVKRRVERMRRFSNLD